MLDNFRNKKIASQLCQDCESSRIATETGLTFSRYRIKFIQRSDLHHKLHAGWSRNGSTLLSQWLGHYILQNICWSKYILGGQIYVETEYAEEFRNSYVTFRQGLLQGLLPGGRPNNTVGTVTALRFGRRIRSEQEENVISWSLNFLTDEHGGTKQPGRKSSIIVPPSPYALVIRSKSYSGYVNQRIITNAI
jgi:hypothetical protein